MARTGVTYEEVEFQANLFIAQGNNPTLEKIRRALGDRGSNSTLSKHLNQWRIGQRHFHTKNTPVSSPLIGHSDLKPSIPDPIKEVISRVWLELKNEAQKDTHQFADTLDTLYKEKGLLEQALEAQRLVNVRLEEKLNQIELHVLEMQKI